MANVEVYKDSKLAVSEVLEFGFDHVVIATGATWRKDGVGISNPHPVPVLDGAAVYVPEDVFAGTQITGPVVIFDDDNFYLGSLIAEKLRAEGQEVILVATEPVVSAWTSHTMEQHRIQARVLELGIEVITKHNLARVAAAEVELACLYTDRRRTITAASVVMVTSRQPNNGLYLDLVGDPQSLSGAGITSVQAVGDCDAPSTIAAAVYDGHRAARELDAPPADPDLPFRREHIAIDA
jgi:dimethylamine/trimethylamine dehydrogenase